MDEQNKDWSEKERIEQEAGARGGTASFAANAPGIDMLAWAKTVVKWSPIWVGLLVALGINLVIQVLGLAITMSSVARAGGYVGDIMRSAGAWGAVASLIALFVGGFLAGRLGVQTGLRNGVLQGTVVWALYVIIAVALSTFGMGAFASGIVGVNDVRALAGGTNLTAAEAHRIVTSTATGLWWAFGGLVVSWLAAIVGGVTGLKSTVPDTADQT